MELVLSWTFTPPKMTTCWMGTLPPQVGNTGITGFLICWYEADVLGSSRHTSYIVPHHFSHTSQTIIYYHDLLNLLSVSFTIETPVLLPSRFYVISPHPCSQCPCFKTRIVPVVYYQHLLNTRLSIVFVISACVWHVISKVTIYVRGIGFQFIVASLCFSLILKLDLWAVTYKS